MRVVVSLQEKEHIMEAHNNKNNTSRETVDATRFDIDKMTIEQIVAANERRNRELESQGHYDPVKGAGCCGQRVERQMMVGDEIDGTFFIPEAMAQELDEVGCATREQWELLRIKHDFEYWCATCVTILDKVSGRLVNMVLNRPQRRVGEK